MERPKNQLAEVLYVLLHAPQTSLDIIQNGVLSPTSKISQLRARGVQVLCDNINTRNKFGRKISYGVFSILNKDESIEVYNQINN
jgi:hypothetical protein